MSSRWEHKSFSADRRELDRAVEACEAAMGSWLSDLRSKYEYVRIESVKHTVAAHGEFLAVVVDVTVELYP